MSQNIIWRGVTVLGGVLLFFVLQPMLLTQHLYCSTWKPNRERTADTLTILASTFSVLAGVILLVLPFTNLGKRPSFKYILVLGGIMAIISGIIALVNYGACQTADAGMESARSGLRWAVGIIGILFGILMILGSLFGGMVAQRATSYAQQYYR